MNALFVEQNGGHYLARRLALSSIDAQKNGDSRQYNEVEFQEGLQAQKTEVNAMKQGKGKRKPPTSFH